MEVEARIKHQASGVGGDVAQPGTWSRKRRYSALLRATLAREQPPAPWPGAAQPHLLEDLQEAAVVGLEDGVLGGQVQRPLLLQRKLKAALWREDGRNSGKGVDLASARCKCRRGSGQQRLPRACPPSTPPWSPPAASYCQPQGHRAHPRKAGDGLVGVVHGHAHAGAVKGEHLVALSGEVSRAGESGRE